MTPWQKFKKEVRSIVKEFWYMPCGWPIWMYDEFRAKCRPPWVIRISLFLISTVLMVLLLVPNLIFVLGVFIFGLTIGAINVTGVFNIKRWLKDINTEQ